MSDKKRRIGFIGLGIMGSAMVRNLLKRGFHVSIYSRNKEKAKEFQALGAVSASTSKELAQISDIIITMVSDDEALENCLYGPIGVFADRYPGRDFINMSTISRDLCVKIAEKCFEESINFMDCPVAGSKPLCEKGELVILAGGKKEDLKRNEDILLTLGKTIIHAGLPPSGTSLKLAINLLLAQMTLGLAESVAFAESMNLNPDLIFQTIKNSPALDCGYFRMKENNLLKKDFTAAFPLKHMLKDLKYINRAAEQKKSGIKISKEAQKVFEQAYKNGFYNEDLSAVLKIFTS